jgi:hypothetical protein
MNRTGLPAPTSSSIASGSNRRCERSNPEMRAMSDSRAPQAAEESDCPDFPPGLLDLGTKFSRLKKPWFLRAKIRCKTECFRCWPAAAASSLRVKTGRRVSSRHLTAKSTNFPCDPTRLKAARCMRPCKVFGPDQTKMFPVKHFATIADRVRAIRVAGVRGVTAGLLVKDGRFA